MESGYEQIYGIIYDYVVEVEEVDEDLLEDNLYEDEEEIEEPCDGIWFPGLDEIAES